METGQRARQARGGKSTPIFRQQSIEARNRLEGAVVVRQPVSVRVLIGGVFVIATVVALTLVFAGYSKRQLATGYIAPQGGFIEVVAPVEGTIDGLRVVEGQSVPRGRVIAIVAQRPQTTEGVDVAGRTDREYSRLLEHIRGRSGTERGLSALAIDRLDAKATTVRARAAALQARITRAGERVRMAESRVSTFESLVKDRYVSTLALDQERMALIDARSAHDDLVLEQATTLRELQDIELQASEEALSREASEHDLARQAIDVNLRMMEARAARGAVVPAPISGRVAALRVNRGQRVARGEVLLTLIPAGSPLLAELYVPGEAMPSVRVGQRVHLKLRAYPHHTYGLSMGKVVEVSSATFDRRALPLSIPLPDEPLFRIRVAITMPRARPGARAITLRAGMLVDADIVMERRALWKWLVAPFEDITGRL